MNEKWIRIMPDYAAEGVWNEEGACLDINEIPISEELRKSIKYWNTLHDLVCEPGYEQSSSIVLNLGVKAIANIGFRLAEEFKKELPDWIVIYHDISRRKNKLDVEVEVK